MENARPEGAKIYMRVDTSIYYDDNRKLVEYFINQEKFETDILANHTDVLMFIHNRIQKYIEND